MEEKSKLDIPYYKVAKEALMSWNGLSEEEAIKKIEESSFEEIEGQVWAKGSMDYAIDGITKACLLDEEGKEKLSEVVYNQNDGLERRFGAYDKLPIRARMEDKNPNEVIMDTLFEVHDGWVKDNQKKFMAREKKHQHMPSELIGWNEVKADLLFVKPIFETLGVEVSEENLEKVYNGRVKEFFLSKDIKTTADLSREIAKGEEFYPALEGQTDIIEFLNDSKNVEEIVIPQIEEKGIGKVEDVRESVVLSEIAKDPKGADLDKLDYKESVKVADYIDKENSGLEEKRDDLIEKNKIIDAINEKIEKRKQLKKEIAIEEAKRGKTDKEFDE